MPTAAAGWVPRWGLVSHLHWVWPFQGGSQQAGGQARQPRLPGGSSGYAGSAGAGDGNSSGGE